MSSKCLHVKLGVQDSCHVCYMYTGIVQCLVVINQLYKVNVLGQRDGKHSLSEMVEAYKMIFFFPFVQRTREMANLVSTKSPLQPTPDTAMLFHPLGEATNLSLSHPFLMILEVTSQP